MLRHARGRAVAVWKRARTLGSHQGFSELLEARTLLSAHWPGAVAGVTPGLTGSRATPLTLVEQHGGAAMIRQYSPTYAAAPAFVGPLAAAAAPAVNAAGTFDLVLHKGPNLLADSLASAAFDQAAEFFESIFHDAITVHIDAEIAPLGANTLGRANSIIFSLPFDDVRDRIVADADPDTESFVSQIPSAAAFTATLPDASFSVGENIAANRANLLAMGFPASQFSGGPDSEYEPGVKIDASITFSSQYPFDYDRSDGIDPGKNDFVGVATHEIAHSLGFVSAIDDVDYQMNNGGDGVVSPMPLDLFRFEPGAAGGDFAGATRVLAPGNVVETQVLFDGGLYDPSGLTGFPGLSVGEIPFSTGVGNGDAWQASHWKDEQFLGAGVAPIGMMDPVATTGRVMTWTAADSRAMGLIGWDTAAPPVPASISGTVYDDLNANGRRDAGEGGLSGWSVYKDLNNNGELDEGGPAQSAGTTTSEDILDGQSVTSTFDVSGVGGMIFDLKLILNITHSYVDDLTATLISPRGTSVTLFDQLKLPTFVSHQNFEDTTFGDFAPWAIDDPQSSAPFSASYRPQQRLWALNGENPNGRWQLIVHDGFQGDDGTLNSWSIEFEAAEPSVQTDANGVYEFTDVAAGHYTIGQVVKDGYTQTEPAGRGEHDIDVAEGQQVTGLDFGNNSGTAATSVVRRQLFYNNSSLDGFAPGAGASDDAAVANAGPLFPGEGPATFAHYSTYSRGLNGLMIDVMNLPAGYTPSAADFSFAVGNTNNPAGWTVPSRAPSSITVRRHVDEDGSDRITIIWPDNAIRNQWLKVTVPAGGNIGLTAPDVFYFGHLAGDTGFPDGAASVTGADLLVMRRAIITAGDFPNRNAYDFNRDGRVNAVDLAVAKANQGKSLTRITAPAVAAFAPAGFSELPISAPADTLQPARVWQEETAFLLS